MGLHVIVASCEGDYPGFGIADSIRVVDTTDIRTVLELARSEEIDGICTAGTDVAINALGHVCDALGLPGISGRAASYTTDKLEMKKAFRRYNVTTARHAEIRSLDDARRAYCQLSRPVICKAVDSSGSRGIVHIRNDDDLPKAYDYVTSVTKKDYCIMEELIEGIEFGAQAAVIGGDLQFVMPHGDIVFNGSTDVPVGHYVPYTMADDAMVQVRTELQRCVEALQLDTCAINVDFMLRGDTVYVLEVGARAGATGLPELVSIHYGVDYYEYIVALSLGTAVAHNFVPQQACGSLLIYGADAGALQRITIPDSSPGIDICELIIDYEIGHPIRQFAVGPDRIGQIVFKADTEPAVARGLQHLRENIQVDVKAAGGSEHC